MRVTVMVGTILVWLAGEPSKPADPAAKAVEARKLVVEASIALDARQYDKAAELYVRAIELGTASSRPAYSAACCLAQLGRKDDAFKYLNVAIDQGWTDLEQLSSDPVLEPLRTDERWAATIKRCEEDWDAFRERLGNPELYDELMRRMAIDQQARNPKAPDEKAMARIDADNTAWMKEVLEKHGWPGYSMVGREGAQAAWLLIQHADADPVFQRRCLELLTAAYEKGDAGATDVAYLTDRVLLAEGKAQRYGTQFWTIDGELRPRPIEDEANVDRRRAEMGLEPLATYAARMRSVYQE